MGKTLVSMPALRLPDDMILTERLTNFLQVRLGKDSIRWRIWTATRP